jgi:acyl carrier protein
MSADLPRHARPPLPTPYAAAESEMERTIAAVWQGTLGFERVGIDDNFFELGGDSFLAVRMATELKQALAMDIPVAKLYQGLTIRTLAALLAEGGGGAEERLAAQLHERKESMDRRKEFQERRRSAKRERS